MNSREITISTAGNRNSLKWVPSKMEWSELCDRLKTVQRGSETHAQYMSMSRTQQTELKDIGGFVGGKLFGGRRKIGNVESRDIITLDLDSIPGGKTEEILSKVEAIGAAACVYSTRKHSPTGPRLRVLFCLSKTVTADRYEPIARKIAEDIGMDYADGTTFEINRLMYWPSCSKDSEYVYRVFDQPLLDPDRVLARYGSNEAWKQVERWPVVPGTEAKIRGMEKRKGDPTEKKGFVGAWCRAHDVFDVLNGILDGVYVPTDDPNRWTFSEGTTYGGAMVYENGQFLFSYHSTDPCSGQLVNSWDLCRLHLYGELDKDSDVDDKHPDRLPSHIAMIELAKKDTAVIDDISRQNIAAMKEDFKSEYNEDMGDEEDSLEWMRGLLRDDRGNLKPVLQNFEIIAKNDPHLSGIRLNSMSKCIEVTDESRIPWKRTSGKIWDAFDEASCRLYFSRVYNISGKDKAADAIMGIALERAFDPIVEYIEQLPPWDGVRRLDTLLCDFLGAEDNPYVRSVTRKTFVACIARQYEPGRKFDTVLTLVGPQGIGKSTFFSKFGGEWFSDGLTLTDMKDKTGAEKLQGRWLVEMGELVGMKKAESEAIKSFLSCRDDVYRGAYTANAVNHPRRCVIVATTNAEDGFLRDTTGNRRFWPVHITGDGMFGAVDAINTKLVQDIWAEALALYRAGETLYLDDPSINSWATDEQRVAVEQDDRMGIVRSYLDTLLPDNWDALGVQDRRSWLRDEFAGNKGTHKRRYVSCMEIWCECFCREKADMTRASSMEIARIMAYFTDWYKPNGGAFTKNRGPYGTQKVYVRHEEQDEIGGSISCTENNCDINMT